MDGCCDIRWVLNVSTAWALSESRCCVNAACQMESIEHPQRRKNVSVSSRISSSVTVWYAAPEDVLCHLVVVLPDGGYVSHFSQLNRGKTPRKEPRLAASVCSLVAYLNLDQQYTT